MTAPHSYLSTACWHATHDPRPELHLQCQTGGTRWDGTTKIPAHCKHCPENRGHCTCACHSEVTP